MHCCINCRLCERSEFFCYFILIFFFWLSRTLTLIWLRKMQKDVNDSHWTLVSCFIYVSQYFSTLFLDSFFSFFSIVYLSLYRSELNVKLPIYILRTKKKETTRLLDNLYNEMVKKRNIHSHIVGCSVYVNHLN